MDFCSIASGSSGNCIFVGTDHTNVLIDAGISGKRVTEGLHAIDRDPKELDAILITHEHSDHIKGLGVLARKYGIPVYSTQGTIQTMLEQNMLGKVDSSLFHTVAPDIRFEIGELAVLPFRVSHDAAEPMFYTFQEDGRKLVVMTDTGYVSDRMKGFISTADAYVFESNHDVSMLQMGPYPWKIKRRILSDVGHVSNEDAAVAMSEVVAEKETQIYLAHLSKDNNMKELARMSVSQTLESCGIRAGEFLHLHDTDAEKPTPLVLV